MMVPGLSGHEGRVRKRIADELRYIGIASRTDTLGNLIATLDGSSKLPSIMLFAHMDQIGLMARKIEASGLVRVERVGGVPERALAAQAVLLCVGEGRDVPGIIANKAHHATSPEEKYTVVPYQNQIVDAGFLSKADALAAGVKIGTPIVYAPRFIELAGERVAGTSIDDRAGCAVIVAVAEAMKGVKDKPTIHFVFSVQEEFNLRGAAPCARELEPAIAIQLDLILSTDTPDMEARGEVKLGGGPAMGLFSFHGRGTLNGTIPHPALVRLFEGAAQREGLTLQRSVHIGALTDSAYVQLEGKGIAAIDLGFPTRYTHSALEVADVSDLEGLARLLIAGIGAIDRNFKLVRQD